MCRLVAPLSVLLVLLGLLLTGTQGAGAQQGAADPETVNVDVTVWRRVSDPSLLYVSTRPEGGRWRTEDTALDMSSLSNSGNFHQSNAVRVRVPLEGGGTVEVDVTVWRRVSDPSLLYVSTRPEGGRWRTLNTPLDMSALSSSGNFHQSNAVRVEVILPLTVAFLEVAEIEPLTSIGETAQLSATARMSDGSSRDTARAAVEWRTSDPWVASVSNGVVTAVGAGNATIVATHEGQSDEVAVSVRISDRRPGTVRVLYAAPSDREFRSDYSEAISHAIVDLQSWYRRQLDGLTFSLYQATPEHCRMSEPEGFYATGHAWNKVLEGVQHCAPVTGGLSDFTWVIYVDVEEDCDEYHQLGEGGHELGRGGRGLTIVARADLEGLTNPGPYFYCGEGPYAGTLGRWIGGIGHELAHAFGLLHPPGCDPWDPAMCDEQEASSLVHLGYPLYPETHLLPSDKETLIRSPFFAPMREPLAAPPVALGLDQFYEKYVDAGGLPVVASSDVPDAALFRVRDIIDEMLAHSDDLRATMAEQGVRVAIMANSSVLTDLPEFSDLTEFSPGVSWDERTRGGGVGATPHRPVVVIATPNLLCYGNDVFPHEDIFVHEFAHGVLNMGVERLPGGEAFRTKLNLAYSSALEAGLWTGTYAARNPDEYWAEGVQSWFDLNDPPGPIHNEVNTRAELEAYDPALAALIREVFGDAAISTSCHEVVDIQFDYEIQGVVVGPAGEPLQGVLLWAWQGRRYNSGSGKTGTDGVFEIAVPNGVFTLDVYAIAGECSFVGWYDGSGGIATDSAARVVVEDASVEGITIRLPALPGDLPFIAHCAE